MTVYADVLFIVNFSLDYVSLYITGRLMSMPMRTIRLCAASALGAAYAVASLAFDLHTAVYIPLTLTVTALMCLFAYRCTGVISLLGAAVLLFTVGCALGGAMTAVYSLGAGYSDSLSQSQRDGGGIGVLVSVALTASTAAALGGRVLRRRRGVSTAEAIIEIGGKRSEITALRDSGNLLRDPASGRSVLILSAGAAEKLLPREVADASLSDDAASEAMTLPPEQMNRVRLLPVSNVYGKSMLLGYRPDSVTLVCGGRQRPCDCILAVSKKSGGFGGCDAILPAEFS